MGFISLQSTQVTAKNSTKTRSLCLGIKSGVAVCAGTTGTKTVVVAIAEGIVVAEISCCGAAQANKNRKMRKTNKLILRMTHINVTGQNKYRHQSQYIPILLTQIEKVQWVKDNVYTHWA